MIFKDNYQAARYEVIMAKMHSDDCYHRAVAYLFALDRNLDEDYKLNDCFDFADDTIEPAALEKAWITGFDRRILKLAFALWSPVYEAGVNDVFGYADTPFMCEAIKIRFEC